jgi:hypothetical protein
MNFAAWSADKAIWTRDGYVDDYPLFYVDRKTGVLEHQVVALKPFTWFTAKCIVKSTAQGRAWIEVLSITTTNTTLDRTDLRHLVKANVLASGGEFERCAARVQHGQDDRRAGALRRALPRRPGPRRAGREPARPRHGGAAGRAAPLPDDKELIALLDRATGNSTAPIAAAAGRERSDRRWSQRPAAAQPERRRPSGPEAERAEAQRRAEVRLRRAGYRRERSEERAGQDGSASGDRPDAGGRAEGRRRPRREAAARSEERRRPTLRRRS